MASTDLRLSGINHDQSWFPNFSWERWNEVFHYWGTKLSCMEDGWFSAILPWKRCRTIAQIKLVFNYFMKVTWFGYLLSSFIWNTKCFIQHYYSRSHCFSSFYPIFIAPSQKRVTLYLRYDSTSIEIHYSFVQGFLNPPIKSSNILIVIWLGLLNFDLSL